MTDARSDEVKGLFNAIVEVSSAKRKVLLNTLNPDLRKEVESLLAAEGNSFLDKTPEAMGSLAQKQSRNPPAFAHPPLNHGTPTSPSVDSHIPGP